MTVTIIKTKNFKNSGGGMFENMGGNIPGGNFLGGNFPGGNFPGGSFLIPKYCYNYVYLL